MCEAFMNSKWKYVQTTGNESVWEENSEVIALGSTEEINLGPVVDLCMHMYVSKASCQWRIQVGK